MEKANKIIKALERAGLMENKVCKLSNGKTGIMVSHDYNGPYPTNEAYKKHYTAEKIANRYLKHRKRY